jgi:hypothetical protein
VNGLLDSFALPKVCCGSLKAALKDRCILIMLSDRGGVAVRVANSRGGDTCPFFNRFRTDFVLRVVDLYHGTDHDLLGFFNKSKIITVGNKTVGTMPAAVEHHRHKSIQQASNFYYLDSPK